jgi:hypothetical protein
MADHHEPAIARVEDLLGIEAKLSEDLAHPGPPRTRAIMADVDGRPGKRRKVMHLEVGRAEPKKALAVGGVQPLVSTS